MALCDEKNVCARGDGDCRWRFRGLSDSELRRTQSLRGASRVTGSETSGPSLRVSRSPGPDRRPPLPGKAADGAASCAVSRNRLCETLTTDPTFLYFRGQAHYSREESRAHFATKALRREFRAPMGAVVALGTPRVRLFRLRKWAVEKSPRPLRGRPKYLYASCASCRLCL